MFDRNSVDQTLKPVAFSTNLNYDNTFFKKFMTNLVSCLRAISVTNVLKTPSIEKVWPKWKVAINEMLGSPITPTTVLDLADNLATIYKTTTESGRSQGTLKRGGVAWEGIVCWYLNLCLLGSRTVVIKLKKNLVPEPIRDATTVLYGSFVSNTESDLLAITFPKRSEYQSDLSEEYKSEKKIKNLMDDLAEKHFPEYEVGVIQCKTNWNDNAQVPMLWDMVYHAKGFGTQKISVGRNGYSTNGLKKFTYSFVTVPSSKKDIRGPRCTPVNRVCSLSGGNYWGMPSESGVASSLKEIFQKNFSDSAKHSLRKDLSDELPKLKSEYSYFDL